MASSTAKKVLIERFDRVTMRGYVQSLPANTASALDTLTLEGSAVAVPLDQIKAVCFVRDLDGPSISKERLEFNSRPKSQGLWVEARFTDGSRLEGVLPNNLKEIAPPGYALTPPEVGGNTQRVWIPCVALERMVVLGVVGSPKRMPAKRVQESRQFSLFGESV